MGGTMDEGTMARIRFGCSLREAAVRPERREVEVVCIRPGLSRNGNFYGPEALAKALPLFEGARAYVDHAESAVRSVRDLAGTYRAARLGPQGEVRATLRVAKHADWLWSLIQESVEEGNDLVGLSMTSRPTAARARWRGSPAGSWSGSPHCIASQSPHEPWIARLALLRHLLYGHKGTYWRRATRYPLHESA